MRGSDGVRERERKYLDGSGELFIVAETFLKAHVQLVLEVEQLLKHRWILG